MSGDGDKPVVVNSGGDSVVLVREFPPGYCPIEAGKRRALEDARLGRRPPRRRGPVSDWVADVSRPFSFSMRLHWGGGVVIGFVERNIRGMWNGRYWRESSPDVVFYLRQGDGSSPMEDFDSAAAAQAAVRSAMLARIQVWYKQQEAVV